MRSFAVLLVGSMLALVSAASAARNSNLLRAEAFVNDRCPANERQISTEMWMAGWRFNALYGNCRAGDGTDRHIWFFDGGRYVGDDSRQASRDIVGLWRDQRVITFLYVVYRSRDPNCCPTGGGKIVRFRLHDGLLQRLDPLPADR